MLTMLSLLAAANLGGGLTPPTDAFSAGSAGGSSAAVNNLEQLISNGIGGLTLVAGLLFIFYFVMGGLNWITSGGDTGKTQKARDQMVQGVIGLVIIVLAYGIVGIVGSFVGLDILQPGKVILEQLNPLQGAQQSNGAPPVSGPF